MSLINEGRQIERSDEHFSNADSPILNILARPANANSERLVQDVKQPSEMTLSDEGMQIERSDEQE
jgi:hypothetical protein